MNIAELSRDNPKLLALEEAYSKLNLFDTTQWETFSKSIDIQNFRGEPGYLSQMWGGMTEERYWNTYQYAKEHAADVLEKVREDDAFGCITFYRHTFISRDMLDSVLELKFLKDTVGSDLGLLDIGAGYGRFAHRFLDVFRGGFACCVDAIPLSSFLCDFYLSYRLGQYYECWSVMYLDEVAEGNLGDFPNVDIACNMYSFSEMSLSAVKFWLDLCSDLNIRYFFLVPHAGDLIHPHYVTSEPDGSQQNYYPEFEKHGYREIRRQWKFPEAESAKYIYNTQYVMFQRG